MARAAGERGVDGVVCGHIHTAEFREFDHNGRKVEYWNDGDWVEGCNALVEHEDGRMEILNWPEEIKRRQASVETPVVVQVSDREAAAREKEAA